MDYQDSIASLVQITVPALTGTVLIDAISDTFVIFITDTFSIDFSVISLSAYATFFGAHPFRAGGIDVPSMSVDYGKIGVAGLFVSHLTIGNHFMAFFVLILFIASSMYIS